MDKIESSALIIRHNGVHYCLKKLLYHPWIEISLFDGHEVIPEAELKDFLAEMSKSFGLGISNINKTPLDDDMVELVFLRFRRIVDN